MTSKIKNKSRKKPRSLTRIRKTILALSLLGTFLLGLRHIMPGEESRGGSFDSFCPFGGVESLYHYLTTGQTLEGLSPLTFSILIGVLGVSLLGGRAFCGWMCPLGAAQEFLAGLARRLSGGGGRKIRGKPGKARFPTRFPQKIDKWLRYGKYVVLAIVLVASVRAVALPLYDLCPARAVFSFKLNTPLLWSVLITFIVTSMWVDRFWCKYLCPLGALLAIFNKIAPLRIAVDNNHCVACGRCETDCPMDIADTWENTDSLECIQCMECVETCALPDTMTIRLGWRLPRK